MKFSIVVVMENTQTNHISEDVLERFVMQRCTDEEAELVETHTLACENCISQLEEMELQVAATKLALREMQVRQNAAEAAKQQRRWNWSFSPRFAMGAGFAVLALGVALSPQMVNRYRGPAQAADFEMSLQRGSETSVLPLNRPLHLHLNHVDLPDGAEPVAVFDQQGTEIWKSSANVRNNTSSVSLPALKEAGPHYLRVAQGDQLLEFAFQVR